MTRNEAKALRNTVIQGKMAEVCGGIVKKKEQSDKYGYDLDIYYIGNEIIKKHYVKKNKNKGTADNPIKYKIGMPVIKKLYYKYKGKRYMAIKSGIPTSVSKDFFVEF